ncbi:MAG: hypothetical protein RBR86_00540 [Pseudobdellovibrionaceae bacterium]|jgi:hypothetical protein|nr:hypothetical protein [Pseudobdellovibrionaceae bacterium]
MVQFVKASRLTEGGLKLAERALSGGSSLSLSAHWGFNNPPTPAPDKNREPKPGELKLS